MSSSRLAILISGRGSNMLAIANACRTGELHANVALVLSNRKDAGGLASAQSLGIPTAVVEHSAFESRDDFELSMTQHLERVNPDWILLAGFMRILGNTFVKRWQGQILNIHPSLLPLYPGLNTHARALEAGDREAGASVHVVTPELDAGPVIEQVRVPVLSNDTPDTLAQRVLSEEHGLYVKALKQCVNVAIP